MLIKLREAMKRCCGTSASKCCQPKASVAFAHHHKPAHHSQVELMSPTSRAAAAAHVDAKSDETF